MYTYTFMQINIASPQSDRRMHAPDVPVDSEDMNSLVLRSQARSMDYGLSSFDAADFSRQSHLTLLQSLEENKFLFQHAAPVMESLYAQIVGTHSVVLLTTADGTVLHSLGDPDFLEKASRVALVPGVNWSEKTKGTNAIGTALHEKRPLLIEGSQHFMNVNQSLSCSCTPIVDPKGHVIGALDVTGDQRNSHLHTLGLVRMSGQMIENHMFAETFSRDISIRFHARIEFLGTLVEGITVFSPDGRFLAANRSAQFQLGLSHDGLRAHTFSSLFGVAISQIHDLFSGIQPKPCQLNLFSGLSVWCMAKLKPRGPWLYSNDHPKQDSTPKASASTFTPRKSELSSLRYLDTGDPQVAAVIRKLCLVRNHDIPIMILGETGTGKDLMAHAIHSDSERRAHPFISVNCASIPETLIESELFGYEEGAFTGARKKGAIGKIQQADGGTLFLDEIGDMPMSLQAKLLRALQEGEIEPLGSNRLVPFDARVVAATSRDVQALVREGRFREDLYYRLNVLPIRVPPLRERREDIHALLETLGEDMLHRDGVHPPELEPQALALLGAQTWRGNIRELRNVLEQVTLRCDTDRITAAQVEQVLRASGVAEVAPALPVALSTVAEDIARPLAQQVAELEQRALAAALVATQGNKQAAARRLGISRAKLYALLENPV